jgi:2-amino-4-hydroxy-6-hydroxymethyldihydropteridine diphosphokinase
MVWCLVTRAFIALGANLGDREANLQRAMKLLGESNGVKVIRVSSFYDNPAVGGPESSPTFLNAAAEIETSLSPRELMDRLLEIERMMGRVRGEKWGPRIIDLDLLLYGDEIVAEKNLTVPHPLMHDRAFVLVPLAEIAAREVHPLLHVTIEELRSGL